MNIKNLIDLIKSSDRSYNNDFFTEKDKLITCMNSAGYLLARKDLRIYENFDGIYIDGIWMCMFILLFWGKKIERRSFDMTSIANDLFTYLNQPQNNESIFFLGSKQEQVEKSINIFKESFPNMHIIGYRNGYFKDEADRKHVIGEIIKLNPNYVVVGLGKPKQDYFAIELKDAGFKGTVFTCGGFLHQSCDKLHYYPKWIDKYNLRFLYRFIKEGTWGRLYNDLFVFPFKFVFDRCKSLI